VKARLALSLLLVTAVWLPAGAFAQAPPSDDGPALAATTTTTVVAPPGPTPPTTPTPTPTTAGTVPVTEAPSAGTAPVPEPATVPPEPTTTEPPDTTPPTLGVAVAHPNFSPNGDRVRDKAFFTLTAAEPITLDVSIHNASGASKVEHYEFGPGPITVTWGGRIRRADGTMGRARDGAYTVKFTASDGAGNELIKRRTVRVDTVAPTVAWRSITPEPWGATGPVAFNLTTADRSGPLRLQATAWDRDRLLDRSGTVPRPVGTTTFSWRPDYSDGTVFLPGNYFGAVRATDDAGNSATSAFRAFRVDRSIGSVVVRRADAAGNRVAVTFDDCNEGAAWRSILSTLRAYNVRATFFCPGDQVYAHPSEARATVAGGHAIGSHSNGHAQLDRLSYAEIAARLNVDKTAWWTVAGATPTPYFRPPYGNYDAEVLHAAGDLGFRYTVIWDVDPQDWTSPGSGAIASRVLGSARPGSIILLHVRSQTAAALPSILAGLRARGLQQSTMPELLHAAGWH